MAHLPLTLIKKIRKIQIMTSKLAKDLLAGAYLSAFKGKGLEFEDVRLYQNGDEVRDIDWKVTARMNYPYVKNFREERDINVTLAVDISGSENFGSTPQLKSDLIAEIAALIAFSAIKNNDKVGLILFSETVEKYIPPKKGVRHVLHLILQLLTYVPKSQKTDIANALKFIGNISRKSAVYFLISDFIDKDFSKEAEIIAKKCDLIAISLTDPHEIELPKLSLVELAGLENQESLIADFSSNLTREEYRKKALQRISFVKSLMGRINAGFIDIRAGSPYLKEIIKFFKLRGKKR